MRSDFDGGTRSGAIAKALMVALAMVMFQVFMQCIAEHRSADRYQF
jgi:hypothetical protein